MLVHGALVMDPPDPPVSVNENRSNVVATTTLEVAPDVRPRMLSEALKLPELPVRTITQLPSPLGAELTTVPVAPEV